MTMYVPGWMQGGSYTAHQDRINSRAASYDEGVADRLSFKVVPRAAGANLTVDIGAGTAIITGDDEAFQGNYDVMSDAVSSVAGFVATGSNTRYDLVGIQINDPNAGGAAGNNAVLTRIAGIAAASPVIPTIPNSFLPLAIVGPFTTSTTQITAGMIHDAYTGTGPAGVTGVRLLQGLRKAPGSMEDTFNAVAPNGWLVAAGQAVSRTVYAALFEHFGIAFGAGDGASTFNIPDLRGRVFVALDNQGGSDGGRLAAANALGGSGGEELHTLSTAETGVPPHGHTVNDPGHFHLEYGGEPTSPFTDIVMDGGAIGHSPNLVPTASTTETKTTGVTVNNHPGTAATAHNNMQPYILGYKIVRT